MTTQRIRKTIAFPSPVLEKLSQKASTLGLTAVEYIRFLAIRDAASMSPMTLAETDTVITTAKEEYKAGNLTAYSSGTALLKDALSS